MPPPKTRSRAKPQAKPETLAQPETVIEKVLTTVSEEPKKVRMEDMPLSSLGDYMRYNKRASEENKKAKKADKKLKEAPYPLLQCPQELHPKETVIIGRKDQPTTPIPVHLSDNMIHFVEKVKVGVKVTLPRCVVEHIASKGTNQWGWVTLADGTKETRVVGSEPRFTVRTVYGD